MSRQVTLELPDEVLLRAERLAAESQRTVGDLLSEVLTAALPPVDSLLADEPVGNLSDEAVLRLSKLRLPPPHDQRLSDLLYRQQSGEFPAEEQEELERLMHLYSAFWIRQSEALVEAVKRGLRPPLTS